MNYYYDYFAKEYRSRQTRGSLWTSPAAMLGNIRGNDVKDCRTTLKNAFEGYRCGRNIEVLRFDLNYDIDGVVVAVDDMRTRELLGYTVKFPKWAIAFKFEAQEATTTLLDVEWNVGRSGRVGPTAILEPIELAGVTVKRATLNKR
mgnify:CR=1 FL=1